MRQQLDFHTDHNSLVGQVVHSLFHWRVRHSQPTLIFHHTYSALDYHLVVVAGAVGPAVAYGVDLVGYTYLDVLVNWIG